MYVKFICNTPIRSSFIWFSKYRGTKLGILLVFSLETNRATKYVKILFINGIRGELTELQNEVEMSFDLFLVLTFDFPEM